MKTLRHIFTLMLLATLVACSNDTTDGVDKRAVNVTFTLALQDETVNSRAANIGWDDYDPSEDGTEAERTIDPNDLVIILYNASNKVVGKVENIYCTKAATTAGTYAVNGTWKPDTDEQLKSVTKVVVVANSGNPDPLTVNVETISFIKNAQTEKRLPMWGVTALSSSLRRGRLTDLGTVYMLRAMAKISVQLREDMTQYGFTLGNISLNVHNERGYTLPRIWKKLTKTTELTFANTLHPLDDYVSTTPLAFSVAADGMGTAPVYVPEYENSAASTKAALSVQLLRNGEEEGTYTVPFCVYDDEGSATDTERDIMRNHHYLFVLYKTQVGIKVTLHVRNWNKVVHDEVVM